jgi:site-specific DNA-methyltransferase (adenine-specific)
MKRHQRIQLYLGDCLQVMQRLPDRSVHAVITDPPYGTTDCHWDQVPDLDTWWMQIERVATEGAIIAIFCAQPFTTHLINSRRKLFRYDLVWDKVRPVGFLNANRQPMRVHEQVIIFCRRPKLSTYQPQFLPGTPYISRGKARGGGGSVYRKSNPIDTINIGTRHPTSILRFAKPGKERRHPTEKPVTLLNWLVRSYSRPGQTILDPFMGSASLIEAAASAGRRAIGIERDPTIFRTAVDRASTLVRRSQIAVCSDF